MHARPPSRTNGPPIPAMRESMRALPPRPVGIMTEECPSSRSAIRLLRSFLSSTFTSLVRLAQEHECYTLAGIFRSRRTCLCEHTISVDAERDDAIGDRFGTRKRECQVGRRIAFRSRMAQNFEVIVWPVAQMADDFFYVSLTLYRQLCSGA